MLKKYFYIIILLFTAVNALADPDGSYGNLLLLGRSPKTVSSQQGDSIMRKVIEQADKYHSLFKPFSKFKFSFANFILLFVTKICIVHKF